jgi:hypothetical protein
VGRDGIMLMMSNVDLSVSFGRSDASYWCDLSLSEAIRGPDTWFAWHTCHVASMVI